MRIQWEILLFLFCVNLAIGVAIQLNFPGTQYTNPLAQSINATEYEQHFNGTDIATGWSGTPFSGIPLIGDIFAGFNFLWQNIKYLVDGLPTLLTWIQDAYIVDQSAATAFWVISNALRAVYALLICMFLIEFISGRNVSD